jgi:hypothetical protein
MPPLDDSKIVATRILDGRLPAGGPTRIVVIIGVPYSQDRGYRCPLRVTGLDYDYTPPDMAGWDAVHALISAISLSASLLDDFVVRGGQIFYPETETPYEFSDLTLDFRAPKQT